MFSRSDAPPDCWASLSPDCAAAAAIREMPAKTRTARARRRSDQSIMLSPDAHANPLVALNIQSSPGATPIQELSRNRDGLFAHALKWRANGNCHAFGRGKQAGVSTPSDSSCRRPSNGPRATSEEREYSSAGGRLKTRPDRPDNLPSPHPRRLLQNDEEMSDLPD